LPRIVDILQKKHNYKNTKSYYHLSTTHTTDVLITVNIFKPELLENKHPLVPNMSFCVNNHGYFWRNTINRPYMIVYLAPYKVQ